MEYSELPIDFKKLAVLRNLKHNFGLKPKDIKESENLLLSDKTRFVNIFNWANTPEGRNFWKTVEKAKSNTELPFLSTKIYEEISSITLKEEKKKPNFSVGDVVVIEKVGSGFGPECKQKVTQITEIDLDYLPHGLQKPGCRVSDRYGNAVLKEPDDIVALESFRHATASEASKYLVSKAKEKFPVGSYVNNSTIDTLPGIKSFEIDSTHFVKHPDEDNNRVYYIPSRGGNYLVFDGNHWATSMTTAKNSITMSRKDFIREYPKTSEELYPTESKLSWYETQMRKHSDMMTASSQGIIDRMEKIRSKRAVYESAREGFQKEIVSYPVCKFFHETDFYKKEDPNIQPIVEAKVKTKKKNKRLIYKHY